MSKLSRQRIPTINGYSIVPIHGQTPSNELEFRLQVLDLERIATHNLYVASREAFLAGVIDVTEMTDVSIKRAQACVTYMLTFINRVVLDLGNISGGKLKTRRLMAQTLVNVALGEFTQHPDSLMAYLAKYAWLKLLCVEQKWVVEWNDIIPGSPDYQF